MYGVKYFQDTAAISSEYKEAIDNTLDKFTGAISGKYESYHAIYPIAHRNGEVRWVEARSDIPKRDDDGTALLMTGTLIDITDAKKSQDKLEEKNTEMQKLIEELPLPAAHFDAATGDVLHLNESFMELFGYTTNDIPCVEEHWKPFYPDEVYREEVRVEWEGELAKSAESSKPIEPMFLNITAKNGEVKQTKAHTIQVGDLALTVWVDFTEQKEAEEAIQQNNELMTFVSEYASFGFWHFNPQVGDLFVNDVFVEMLGYASKEVLEEGYEDKMFKPFKDGLAFWEQLLHPDDVERTGKIITAHINGESDLYKVDYRMRRADGSWMWSTAIGRIAEYDSEGKPIRFNGVNIDIDEMKKAQEMIENQQQQFESMVSNITGAIYRCKFDEDWTMLYISDEVERLSGYPASDFLK